MNDAWTLDPNGQSEGLVVDHGFEIASYPFFTSSRLELAGEDGRSLFVWGGGAVERGRKAKMGRDEEVGSRDPLIMPQHQEDEYIYTR